MFLTDRWQRVSGNGLCTDASRFTSRISRKCPWPCGVPAVYDIPSEVMNKLKKTVCRRVQIVCRV